MCVFFCVCMNLCMHICACVCEGVVCGYECVSPCAHTVCVYTRHLVHMAEAGLEFTSFSYSLQPLFYPVADTDTHVHT